jgi:hypothetical protein
LNYSELKDLVAECADGLAMCSHSLKDTEFRKRIVELLNRARKRIGRESVSINAATGEVTYARQNIENTKDPIF